MNEYQKPQAQPETAVDKITAQTSANTEAKPETPNHYAAQRIAQIGITQDENEVLCRVDGSGTPQKMHILSDDGSKHHNLAILHLALEKHDGHYIPFTYMGDDFDAYTQSEIKRLMPYQTVRLAKPYKDKKYNYPRGAETQPFFTRNVIDAYNMGLPIQTLILVEGQLKALVAGLKGLYAVGLPGIWGFRRKDERTLHPLIKSIVVKCGVKNLVYLHDGDCRKIKGYEQFKDLAERPRQFSETVIKFRECIKFTKLPQVTPYYAHLSESGPKGLDDLLLSMGETAYDPVAELLGLYTHHGHYFQCRNLNDWDNAGIKSYFFVDSAKAFYDKHSDVLTDEQFKFGSDTYKFNLDTEELECVLPGLVDKYCLVGNKFYHWQWELNSKGILERVRDQRNVEIIKMDFMRQGIKDYADYILKIPHFDGFTNEPDFFNYQREIIIKENHKLLNLTYPIEYTPAQGDWGYTENFLRHLFSHSGPNGYDVFLDMCNMYLTRPKQKQRILSLLSVHREAGKSTLLFWLRHIMGQNMAIVGKQDLENQFNGYITKCIVGVDESKIEDKNIIEMIKSMVTNPYAVLNEKGINQRPIVNHVKLIMTSNHIFNFASIDEAENRWFCVDVPPIAKKDKTLLDKMVEEIPAFLDYIINRPLKFYSEESRFAIPDAVVETEALKRVKENSRPSVQSMIRTYIKYVFETFVKDAETYCIDAPKLHQLACQKSPRFTVDDVRNVLQNEMGLKPQANKYFRWYEFPNVREMHDEESGEVFYLDEWGHKVNPDLPRRNGTNGSAYEFKRKDYLQ